MKSGKKKISRQTGTSYIVVSFVEVTKASLLSSIAFVAAFYALRSLLFENFFFLELTILFFACCYFGYKRVYKTYKKDWWLPFSGILAISTLMIVVILQCVSYL